MTCDEVGEDGGEAGRKHALRHKQLLRLPTGEADIEKALQLGGAGGVGPGAEAEVARPEELRQSQRVEDYRLQLVLPQVVGGHSYTTAGGQDGHCSNSRIAKI